MRLVRIMCLAALMFTPARDSRAQTGQVSADPAGARSQREQLTSRITERWGNYIQEVYKSSVEQWAWAMQTSFARASIATLQRAARARTFTEMNDELLRGDGPVVLPADVAEAARLGDAATDLVFVPVTPCRVFDTRLVGGAIAANTTRDFDIADVANYSPQGGDASNCGGLGAAGSLAAVAVNFTVVTPTGPGYITAHPYNVTRPLAATVNYVAGDIRGNLAVVRLDQTAAVPELSVYTLAQTHLVADVVGYFIRPEATPLECTQTFLSTVVGANAGFDIQLPSCPADYTLTGAGCRTFGFDDATWAINGLYYNNTFGMLAFCSGLNTKGSSITVEGTARCCRVPGR